MFTQYIIHSFLEKAIGYLQMFTLKTPVIHVNIHEQQVS